MTISRPGELPLEPEPPAFPPTRRRFPTWAKVAAAVTAVALVAVANEAATRHERRQERLAADRTDVTVLVTAGDVRPDEFQVSVVVVNAGSPVTLRGPRLADTPTGDAGVEPLGADATTNLEIWLPARCPSGVAEPLALVVDVTPASGRTREVRGGLPADAVRELTQRACS